MTATKLAAGSMHGRFQPFHNVHLEYLQAALDECDYLYVGITQYRRRSLIQVDSAAAAHRAQPQSNPLTFFERSLTLHAVLRSLDVSAERYCITPFPIEEPAELHDFLPTEVTVFTTTYDDWNRRKIRLLEDFGYPVVNLWSRPEKSVTGREVRQLVRDSDPRWRTLVPEAVADVLDALRLGDRLRALALPSEG